MFDLIKVLKFFNSRLHWKYRIEKYIQSSNKKNEFSHSGGVYWCNSTTAIEFIEAITLKSEIKQNILIALHKRKVLELENTVNNVTVAPVEVSKSLNSDHFNINDIKNLESQKIKFIFNNEKQFRQKTVSDVFVDYIYFLTHFYKFNTIRTNIAIIRKAIYNSDLLDQQKEDAIYCFRVSNKIHKDLNTIGEKTREDNMNKVLEPIEVSFLYEFMNESKKYITEHITKANTRTAFTHLTAMISLSIGRRLTEIITQSEVTKLEEYKVLITGLGKKRTDEVIKIIVPTLFLTADEVIEAITKAKSFITKNQKTSAQKDKFAHRLSDFNYIDKRLWNKGAKYDSTRAIYAIVSERIYNQNNIIERHIKPQATYIQGLLGHNDKDRTTYEHYFKRAVIFKDFDLKSYLSLSKTAML